MENINLFGGIVETAEHISKIQEKPKKDITKEEQKMLDDLEKIKNDEITQEEKLEALLNLVISEKDREIYRIRYQVNRKLLEQTPKIKQGIKEGIAKKPISIRQIRQKVFIGENAVTAQDYIKNKQIIERDLQQKENSSIEEK